MKKKRHIVVLADDEESFRDYLESELEFSGFKIIAAKNGEEAFNICLQQDIDVLVSDISMPDLGGFALLKKLRIIGKSDLPVIFMTAQSSHIYDEFTDLVHVEVLSKPFEVEHLVDKIKMVLEGQEETVS